MHYTKVINCAPRELEERTNLLYNEAREKGHAIRNMKMGYDAGFICLLIVFDSDPRPRIHDRDKKK